VSFVIDIRANKQSERFARRLQHANVNAIRQGWFQLGTQLRKDARNEIIRGTKTGRIYRIRRGRIIKNHQASAPGEAPANLSGNLNSSIGYQIKGSDEMEFGYRLFGRLGHAFYGKWLEEGAPNANIEPRPNITPTVEKNEANAQTYFFNAIIIEHARLNRAIS